MNTIPNANDDRGLAQVRLASYASNVLLLPMFLAVLALAVWLLARGVDVPKWEAKAATFEVTTLG